VSRQCAQPSTAAASSESEIMTARYAHDLQRCRPTVTRCAALPLASSIRAIMRRSLVDVGWELFWHSPCV
jgi:hypothetical protein